MIRLAMLARDEADRLPEVAAACGDLIDSWVVLVDDRTTDATLSALPSIFGKPGHAIPFRFRDFAQARNLLLELARAASAEDDYLLLVDPDSPPRGSLPETLDADVYDCVWTMGSSDYLRPTLIRAGADATYVGAAHEYLEHGYAAALLPDLLVDVPPKPDDPERMRWYLEILDRDRATNPRSQFYYARTLKDLGRGAEAIEAYLLRAQNGSGFAEEVFVSLLDAATILMRLDVELSRVLFRRASTLRPGRSEPLFYLAWLANEFGEHDDAEDYALAGLSLPISDDRLFVDRFAESAGMIRELNRARNAIGAREASAAETTSMEA